MKQHPDELSLDADVIPAAQAATVEPDALGLPGAEGIIAISSVSHLSRFADAREWQGIE